MPSIVAPSTAKRTTTKILAMAKLNKRKGFFLMLCLWYHQSQRITCSKQLKHKNKVCKLCKIKNKYTRTMKWSSLIQTLILTKKMRLTLKITCCIFALKILLARRLITLESQIIGAVGIIGVGEEGGGRTGLKK